MGRSEGTGLHLFLIFPNHISEERDGGCAQVRLLVEKGCDSKESGSGEEEESGEELIKDLLMEEFG